MSMQTMIVAVALTAAGMSASGAAEVSPSQARTISKEAYIYAFPMVEGYKTLYAQAVDKGGPNYKSPFNSIGNTAQAFTPKDTAIVTPNSDTPYSFVWMDLRAEPIVLTLPAVDAKRFYHVQLIDLYTHNFAYLGKRTTGSNGGNYLITGPRWEGEKPARIDRVLRSETEIAYAIYRTQLFGPDDLDNVKAIQAGYKVQPLSTFVGSTAPPPAPAVDWPAPDLETMTTTPEIFRYLNFLMGFAPTHPGEKDLVARFATIGIEAGKPFDVGALSPDMRNAIADGIADGVAAFEAFKHDKVDTGQVSTADMFGTREHLKNNYLYRYAAAKLGIYGNSGEEAIYHGYFLDAGGAPLNGAQKRYALKFEMGKLPPAQAFWSVTMYDGKTQLLVDNPLNRYLINSSMLPQLKTDADGGVTLHVQHDKPSAAAESNWLPAPGGPFFLVLRLYEPKPEAMSRAWPVPLLKPLE